MPLTGGISFVDIDLAEMRTLCVDVEFRKQGIAQSLLNETVNFLKEKKMRKILYDMKKESNNLKDFL